LTHRRGGGEKDDSWKKRREDLRKKKGRKKNGDVLAIRVTRIDSFISKKGRERGENLYPLRLLEKRWGEGGRVIAIRTKEEERCKNFP